MSVVQIPSDPFHLIVRLAPGDLPAWETDGWVCVESFADEQLARDRFDVLRPALESLQASAAMIRGIAQSATQTVSHDKTVISREAEFWTLRSVEISLAPPELKEHWEHEVARLLREVSARDAARLAPRKPPPPERFSRRTAAIGLGAAVVAIVAVTRIAMPSMAPDSVSPTSAAKRDGMTVISSDPKDANFMIEYELHPDGTRTVVARYPRGQKPEDPAAAQPRARTLADGVNMLQRIRQ